LLAWLAEGAVEEAVQLELQQLLEGVAVPLELVELLLALVDILELYLAAMSVGLECAVLLIYNIRRPTNGEDLQVEHLPPLEKRPLSGQHMGVLVELGAAV
jgi:hypothetical protein